MKLSSCHMYCLASSGTSWVYVKAGTGCASFYQLQGVEGRFDTALSRFLQLSELTHTNDVCMLKMVLRSKHRVNWFLIITSY
jgi:hypothetical protein